jgi:hypothetical protein
LIGAKKFEKDSIGGLLEFRCVWSFSMIRRFRHINRLNSPRIFRLSTKADRLSDGLTLQDFIQGNSHIKTKPASSKRLLQEQSSLSFFIETYGCQMNVSDSEVVRSVLLDAGHRISDTLEEADIILANTCAIRDNAEAKVWHRLNFFKSLKLKNRVGKRKSGDPSLLYPI